MSDNQKAEKILDLVYVKSGPRSEANKVALWDRDPRHPKAEGDAVGEVWVNGGTDKVVQVYPNAAIQEKLRLGILEEVKAPKETTSAAPPAKP